MRLLSPRELEIAALVADGMANKEIGLTLGISHWTVSAHLRRIFIKLEIGRRIDLCLLYRGTEADRPAHGRS
jgi:DNA-binding CsgD family transcriptional regulator